jgi:hypothetical protein
MGSEDSKVKLEFGIRNSEFCVPSSAGRLLEHVPGVPPKAVGAGSDVGEVVEGRGADREIEVTLRPVEPSDLARPARPVEQQRPEVEARDSAPVLRFAATAMDLGELGRACGRAPMGRRGCRYCAGWPRPGRRSGCVVAGRARGTPNRQPWRWPGPSKQGAHSAAIGLP